MTVSDVNPTVSDVSGYFITLPSSIFLPQSKKPSFVVVPVVPCGSTSLHNTRGSRTFSTCNTKYTFEPDFIKVPGDNRIVQGLS
jgi:hypothetical protein